MKKIIGFFKGIIVIAWLLLAIITTICLISFNDYSVSELGDYSIIVVDNKSLEPDFKKNDIVIVKKAEQGEYEAGEKAFFYYSNLKTSSYINYGEITLVEEQTDAEDRYTFGETAISYSNMIGKANGALKISKIGSVIRLLESRWGFMFLIILPTLFAIVYEVYYISMEVKKEAKKIEKEK